MNDLLKLMETGNNMRGTDKAWYSERVPDTRRETLVAARGMLALGLTMRQTAERLGLSPQALRRRLSRCA